MSIKLRNSIEESTYVVTVSFFDADGSVAVPKMAQWSLKDEEGAIVNGRDAVQIDEPESVEIITLTGDDLALPDTDKPHRYLLIEAVYDSILYGNDLSLREEGKFKISNLVSKS